MSSECFFVEDMTRHEHEALRNLARGEATLSQQKLALALISNKFARTHDVSFVPGAPDQSAFIAGRAYVGLRILRALNIPVGKLQYKEIPED